MNKSNLAHTWQAALIQVPFLLCGYWWMGAAVGSFFFLGRELAQAEYRWIERFGGGLRANLPWWGMLDPKVWDVHSWWWNLLLPSLVVTGIAGVCEVGLAYCD